MSKPLNDNNEKWETNNDGIVKYLWLWEKTKAAQFARNQMQWFCVRISYQLYKHDKIQDDYW